MDSYSAVIRNHQIKTEAEYRAVFLGVTEELQRSVTTGSEITGSAGQPVQSGALRSSWIPRFTSAWTWLTETILPYARSIEDGISYANGGTPMTLRSEVGGFHSVSITAAGFQRIVDAVVQRVVKHD